MKRIFVLAIAAAALPLSAQAQTRRQTNFMETVSLLMYGEERCPSFRVNIVMIAQAAHALKIEPKDWSESGRFFGTMTNNYKATKAQFSASRDAVFCQIIEDGFGPGGTMIPDAMKKR